MLYSAWFVTIFFRVFSSLYKFINFNLFSIFLDKLIFVSYEKGEVQIKNKSKIC